MIKTTREDPFDLAKRLTIASESLLEVKPQSDDMMQAIILKATIDLLLQTAAWITQQEVDKLGH